MLTYGWSRLGYDAVFSLTWGEQLYRLEGPEVRADGAPTPHPLSILVGMVLAPLGADAAATGMVLLTFLALATAGQCAWLVGSRVFGAPCGVLFAMLVVTRPGFVGGLSYASTDLWFVALVLAAAAQLARSPDRVLAPMALLALGGLLRPEGWALAALHLGLVAGRDIPRRRLGAAAGLALAAPVVWMGLDWAWAGDPLHSLAATRDLAETLERPRGTDALYLGPRYLELLLGEPVLWAGLGGCVLILVLAPERGWLPVAALGVGLGSFAILALTGLPLIERYLVLPAVALALLAAAAATGWFSQPAGVARRRWMVLGLAMLGAAVVLIPSETGRLRDVSAVADERSDRQRALRSLASHLRDLSPECIVEVPDEEALRVVALFGGVSPRQLVTPADRAIAADQRMTGRGAPGPVLAGSGDLVLVVNPSSTVASRCS